MNRTVKAGPRTGSVRIPFSKSYLHRLLICAALGENETELICGRISDDVAATMRCLSVLGASFRMTDEGRVHVRPTLRKTEGVCRLRCGESGSTLRFLLPVAAALGCRSEFLMEGRLPQRPIGELVDVLNERGARIARNGYVLTLEGKLSPGEFAVPGNISSQFISGLLLALPILGGRSTVRVKGKTESAGYIGMTLDVLERAGVRVDREKDIYTVYGDGSYGFSGTVRAEGDWSGAAPFLCIGAMSDGGVCVQGLDVSSKQGDRRILDVLEGFGAEIAVSGEDVTVRKGILSGQTLDASDIPDLVPSIGALAAAAEGETVIEGAGRLRLKESDRLRTVTEMLSSVGADVEELPEGLVVRGGKPLTGGTADACGDHRIAMAAAVAACACEEDVTVLGAGCVGKSYPGFWEDFGSLEEEG